MEESPLIYNDEFQQTHMRERRDVITQQISIQVDNVEDPQEQQIETTQELNQNDQQLNQSQGIFASLKKWFTKNYQRKERKDSDTHSANTEQTNCSPLPKSPELKRFRSKSIDFKELLEGDKGCNSVHSNSSNEECKTTDNNEEMRQKFSIINDTREQYLILVVHGIGTKEEWQTYNINEFQRTIQRVQYLYFQDSKYEFVFKMVEWNSLINNNNAKEKLTNVTITEGVQSVRQLFNDTVVDILFYLSKAYRQRIIQKIADEANKHFDELYKNGENQRFKGKVSFVAHSLGSVILYDLLLRQWPKKGKLRPSLRHIFDGQSDQNQDFFSSDQEIQITQEDKTLQLKFEIQHLFLLGSPLGLFISVYNEENFIKERLPTCKYFYNIYHPQDIVAYRIEPLFQKSESDVKHEIQKPVILPYYKNNGYRPFNQFSYFLRKRPNEIVFSTINHLGQMKKEFKHESQFLKQALRESNYGTTEEYAIENDNNDNSFELQNSELRYDFCLQERGVESLLKPVGLLQSHIRYFKTKDVSYFILKKIHKQYDIPYHL